MEWYPSQVICEGKYVIQKRLGDGGFGVTYSAVEQSTGKLVAIKTLNEKRQAARDFHKQQERFVNEAMRIKAFRHPHIVRVDKLIQEKIQEEDQEFILWGMVMQYIDGINLSDYVNKYGQLSEADALLYIDQISQALEYIHDYDGMIHRDIKPHNIVLRHEKKETTLIDFGLACQIDKITTRNGKTRGFAPLEQYGVRGNLGFYTDVYALATTLYYLLTANGMKQKGDHIHESVVRKLENLELKPPQYYNSQISQRVNDAIIKGMELEIKDRPQSMREFRELLGLVSQPSPKSATLETVRISPPPKLQSFTEVLESRDIFSLFRDDVILEMLAIPGGTFLMGSPDGEGDNSEKPQHQVTVPPFYMGKYPVTQAQWERVADLPKVRRDLKSKPSYFQGANLPVETVSWLDAQEFCARISKATGKIYRLPSEAEWEYACRAGTTTPYYFGDQITKHLVNCNQWYYRQTTEVGFFPPNIFGLYDMHGNVWEWCEDDWIKNYVGVLLNGNARIANSELKLLRGGSWFSHPENCRSASRNNDIRDDRDSISSNFGFRVVCPVE